MTGMKRPAISRTPDPGLAQAVDDATDDRQRDLPHFESLITPGLFKGPILPKWLSKPFRRKATHVSR
jgi:hypothetical protein